MSRWRSTRGDRRSRVSGTAAGGPGRDLGRGERLRRWLRWHTSRVGTALRDRVASIWKRAGIEAAMALLVVSLFAAAASPVYLSARTESLQAAAESDLRNGAAAAQRYAADHEGRYSGVPPFNTRTLREEYDWSLSEGVENARAEALPEGGNFILEVSISDSEVLRYSSRSGEVSEEEV